MAGVLTISGVLAGSARATVLREAPRPSPEVVDSVGRLIADFRFVGLDGVEGTFSEYARGSRFTVVALTGTACPLNRKYGPVLARIEEEWASRGVRFLYLFPPGAGTEEEIRAAVADRGYDGVCVADEDLRIAGILGARTTTEVFLVDSARTLLYRGAVDDQYGLGYQKDAPGEEWLVRALKAVTADARPAVVATTAPGCDLDDPPAPPPAPVTWHNRVSRIVQQRCQDCHHNGGVAPFALETREDVLAHAGMIRRVVRERVMPPWFAGRTDDQPRGHWANDLSLTDAERADFLAWLAGDRAEGSPLDGPVPRRWPDGWTIGTPDSVIEVPRDVPVKAEGRMDYVHIEVKTGFPADRWVNALEVRPTAQAQVHHVLVFVLPAGTEGRNRRQEEGDDFLAAYVPGQNVLRYPAGYGKRIPAGATLMFQLHYTPNGTATVDRTKLGLKFTDRPVREVRVAAAKTLDFLIPPGADNHEVRGSLAVPVEVEILSFMPHMHVRGKAFRYELVTPGGERRLLLDVPRYDFNWQQQYTLSRPLRVAAGSRIEATAWYDNSAGNPANPDPGKAVRFGLQTEEEMMFGYLEYVRVPSVDVPVTLSLRELRTLGRRLDSDGDGRVSVAEAGEDYRDLHSRLDADGDGYVTYREAMAATGESGRPRG